MYVFLKNLHSTAGIVVLLGALEKKENDHFQRIRQRQKGFLENESQQKKGLRQALKNDIQLKHSF